jgi:hypothetical protein
MARRFYAQIRDELLHADTLKELSELYCEIRDETGEGCSTFRPVNVCIAGTGEVIGHISYNGRVWDQSWEMSSIACLDKSKLLYDNRLPTERLTKARKILIEAQRYLSSVRKSDFATAADRRRAEQCVCRELDRVWDLQCMAGATL